MRGNERKGGVRNVELYQLAKKKEKKADVPTDEYKFEKEKDEYTFAPNISKPKIESKSTQRVDPMIESAIERLKKGREERERVKKGTERNIDHQPMKFDNEGNKFKRTSKENSKLLESTKTNRPVGKAAKKEAEKKPAKSLEARKNHSKQSSSQVARQEPRQELKPATEQENKEAKKEEETKERVREEDNEEKLYIDVNLGDSVKRIVVRKGDTAEALARDFASEHSSV